MNVIIRSDRQIDEQELKKIKDILVESLCPNESLINSIPDCQGIRGNVIQIGNTVKYETVL